MVHFLLSQDLLAQPILIDNPTRKWRFFGSAFSPVQFDPYRSSDSAFRACLKQLFVSLNTCVPHATSSEANSHARTTHPSVVTQYRNKARFGAAPSSLILGSNLCLWLPSFHACRSLTATMAPIPLSSISEVKLTLAGWRKRERSPRLTE